MISNLEKERKNNVETIMLLFFLEMALKKPLQWKVSI